MNSFIDQIVNFFTVANVTVVVCAAILSITLDSFIEWAAHRYPMHMEFKSKLLPLFHFLYKHHVVIHHKVFDKDHYNRQGDDQRDTIAFPLWVGPLLIATAVLPFYGISLLNENMIWFWTSLTIAILYYIVFESLHQLEHMEDKPAVKWLRSWKVFVWLDTHHEIHHNAWRVNFNLVCPLADWLTGTYLSVGDYTKQLAARKKAAATADT